MSVFIFGLFGLIVGSFLNVLILRHGERPLGGRSACMSCGRQLAWYELLPVLSWLALYGRCRTCKARISIQYPLVEVATALLFALLGAAPLPLLFRLLGLPIAALLVAITAYDLRHMIIPDAWSYTCAGCALIVALVAAFQAGDAGTIPLVLLAGPAVALPLFALWYVSRGTWMGLGDAKLALSFGWLLGIAGGLEALFLAFIIGAVVSLPLLLFSSEWWKGFTRTLTLASRRFGGQTPSTLLPQKTMPKLVCGFTMTSEIPFGPFLIISCLFVWFTHMYDIHFALLALYGL